MTSFTTYFKTFSILIVSTAFVYCNWSLNEAVTSYDNTQNIAMLAGNNIVFTNGTEKNTTLNSDSVAVNLMDSQKVIKKTHLINNEIGVTLEKKSKKPLILKKIVVL